MSHLCHNDGSYSKICKLQFKLLKNASHSIYNNIKFLIDC